MRREKKKLKGGNEGRMLGTAWKKKNSRTTRLAREAGTRYLRNFFFFIHGPN